MKKGEFLYTGEMSELLQMAKGHIWVGTVRNEEEARMWEQTCHITSKQYTESGLRVKIISGENRDQDVCSRRLRWRTPICIL